MVTDADFVDASFEAELAALRERFLAGLPERRAGLLDAWNHCVDDAAEEAWLALRRAAHRLSGSAPCYGLEALGAAARELDALLSARPPCRARQACAEQVARLRQLLDSNIGTL